MSLKEISRNMQEKLENLNKCKKMKLYKLEENINEFLYNLGTHKSFFYDLKLSCN